MRKCPFAVWVWLLCLGCRILWKEKKGVIGYSLFLGLNLNIMTVETFFILTWFGFLFLCYFCLLGLNSLYQCKLDTETGKYRIWDLLEVFEVWDFVLDHFLRYLLVVDVELLVLVKKKNWNREIMSKKCIFKVYFLIYLLESIE